MIDRMILIIMSAGFVFTLVFMGYSYGSKEQCEKDRNYLYSFDYGKCVRVGVEKIK